MNKVSRLFSDDSKWNYFVTNRVAKLVKDEKEVDERLKAIVTKYIMSMVTTDNFKNSITGTTSNFSISWFARRLNLFAHAWKLKFTDEILLGFTFIDGYGLHNYDSSQFNRPIEYIINNRITHSIHF